MTVSSTLEATLRGRGSSSAPADAAAKVLGVAPCDEAGKARIFNVVHWSYGIGWGMVRGLLHAGGIDGIAAPVVHFTAVWGGAQVMLPALDVAPAPWHSPAEGGDRDRRLSPRRLRDRHCSGVRRTAAQRLVIASAEPPARCANRADESTKGGYERHEDRGAA